MPESTRTSKPPPKSENLVVAFLPPWKRAGAQAILKRKDEESARLLGRVISQENARVWMRTAILVLPASLLYINAAVLPWYLAAPGLIALLTAVYSALSRIPSRLETAALETLSHGENSAYIAPCLDALWKRKQNAPQCEEIKQALARLLPQCTQEVFDLLTLLQRRSLFEILNYDQRDSYLQLHQAVLGVLGRHGDWSCLGAVYRQATREATIPAVRTAAQDSVEQMGARFDFGSVDRIPEYTEKLMPNLYPKSLAYQTCGICILALRRLVPQLTRDNYQSILSEGERDRLYQLLSEQSLYGNYRYGKEELFLEIIAAAHRLKDTRAIEFLRIVALTEAQTVSARRLRAAARETLELLEAQVEKEKVSRVLLRGASAPNASPSEMLRAVVAVPSVTAPDELLRASPPTACVSVRADLPPEQSPSLALQQRQTTEP